MNDWPTLIEPTQSNLSYRFCLKPMTLRGGANVKTDMGPFFFRRVDFFRPYLSLVCVPYCHGIIIKRVEKPGLN